MTIKHESLRDCSRQQLEFPAHDNLSCSNPCCKFLRSNGRASILVSECKYSLVYPATCRHNGIFDSMQNAIRARSHKMRSSRGAAQPCHERPAATDSDSSMFVLDVSVCLRPGHLRQDTQHHAMFLQRHDACVKLSRVHVSGERHKTLMTPRPDPPRPSPVSISKGQKESGVALMLFLSKV